MNDTNKIVGWLLIAVGFLLTLTLFFAIIGVPMMIVGAGMISGGGGSVTQQVIVNNMPTPEHIPLGAVRDGHQYRMASDGRAYWYPMTEEEQRAHRITALEGDLGIPH